MEIKSKTGFLLSFLQNLYFDCKIPLISVKCRFQDKLDTNRILQMPHYNPRHQRNLRDQ